MKVNLLHPVHHFEPSSKLPPQAEALVQDLELNVLFEAMAQKDRFLQQTIPLIFLSSLDDVALIHYRQEVLKDCLKNPSVIRDLYQIPEEAIQTKRKNWLGIFTTYPGGVLGSAIELLDMFLVLLRKMRRIVDENFSKFESPAFIRLFTMLQQELSDAYFAQVDRHLQELRFRNGVLISATLGQGNEGTNYTLCKDKNKDQSWDKKLLRRKPRAYSYTLSPRDDAGLRALGELRDRGINRVANALAQSADHIDNFFNTLRFELSFYIGCLNLKEILDELEEPICIPQPVACTERLHSFTGLYDPSLSLSMKNKVVSNDVHAAGKNLIFISGANQGGKTTFLRSIGVAQLMMQSGMFVTAESFSANICRGLFTHFKREEDKSMESGKFDEELQRMSKIVDWLTPDAMILFNESFAATNEREGSEISSQILHALLENHIKVFFVTHHYELVRMFFEDNLQNVLLLNAERLPDGSRTFRLRPGEPMPSGFGKDLYQQVFHPTSKD
ncbi:MAG: MutS-related protein [Chloroflexota bacterium]